MPFLPVRIAVQKNLGILGVCLELYRAGVSDSPFRKIQFGGSIAAKEAISKIAARAPDLIPTVLQFEVDHQPYIDIIPCHEIRDKILEMVSGGGLDQGELCRDIESGLSVWGRTAWDRRSWEWSSEFVKKWVWLFENEETLAATNFWRAQRGEAAIVCGGDVE